MLCFMLLLTADAKHRPLGVAGTQHVSLLQPVAFNNTADIFCVACT